MDLSQHALCVHSSLRSFGWVEGGADTIIDGLLAEGCTVMVPTFSWTFAIPAPPNMRPDRNAWNYESPPDLPMLGVGRIYSTESNELEDWMGAVPAALIKRPGRIRGNHPLGSFSAVGPLAEELISSQGPLNIYGPFEALACMGGWVALMGVDLTSMTLLHFAERMAGRTLFRRWANDSHGEAIEVETGGCSGGFNKLYPYLTQLMKACKVGSSAWQIFPVRDLLRAAAEVMKADPEITRCSPECERCEDAIAGGPMIVI